MQIIIDLDGTICTEERTYSRCLAKANADAVNTINSWYDEGHTIIIYTARTWVEFEMTCDWLQKNNIKYHQLFMGKPVGDVWIDDRAIQFNNNWGEIKEMLSKRKNG